ncbi:sigma 54 modulation/S30EA ribosomal C-terminal domain-containing protein [Nocardia bovistercoris]|uniref:HPF/RaiA family ribosome-associated protein n=1 Tax=Nocardia bovistercoris TaxID=2785916 RepID=A0A931N4Z9_9NOCA|nr:sigma 54 modulation/S30EA ribosomal C-terminal domain-containing protein [Nocardia bovistercoris]MBH0779359.1 HPF/RaiA family ribosome-associated protein [Nocardia bovistercoris]
MSASRTKVRAGEVTESIEVSPLLRVSTGHHVSASAATYARSKLGPALRHAHEPVLGARVRIAGHADPAVARPVVAQINVDVNGRAVRVQVAAATTAEAVDRLADRLKTRLERLARHRNGSRHGRHNHEWNHGDLPRVLDSAQERRIIRRKSYALAGETCDEAAFDMELMDYGFHLFTEAGSGADSVLYRTDGAGYRLAQVDPRPGAITTGALPISMSPTPAPSLDIDDAVVRLEATGMPFVFFHDRATGRGTVLYHRYDGDYGVITPPTRP